MLALKPEDILSLKPGIVLHSLPDQNWYHAFSVVNGDQFKLNQTSYWVLEEINVGVAWDNLRSSFIIHFNISVQDGEADLVQLIEQLLDQQIIWRNDDEG